MYYAFFRGDFEFIVPRHLPKSQAKSKILDNLKTAVALHFAHYNFMRIHRDITGEMWFALD